MKVRYNLYIMLLFTMLILDTVSIFAQGVIVSKTDGSSKRYSEGTFVKMEVVGKENEANKGFYIKTKSGEDLFIPYADFKKMSLYSSDDIEMYAYAEGDNEDDETHFYGWKNGRCAIQRAIDAADGITKTIIHCKGHLNVTSTSQFFPAENGLKAVVFIPSTKSNIELRGDGVDSTSIDVSLPDETANYETYEPMEVWGNNCVVRDMSVTAKNCRYCIHNDASARTVCNGYTISFIGLVLKHYENAGHAFNSCLGLGISSGMTLITEGCRFIHEDTYTPSLYIHDNKNFESGFVWKIKDCVLVHKHSGLVPLLVQSLGSNVEGIIEIENLDMGVDLPVIFCDVNVNNSITRIKGTADYPIGYKTRATDTGLVLKVTSKATGGAGGIRFDENSSAFKDLISSDKGTTEYKDSTGVTHIDGYLCRDGVDVLNSYAMGTISLDKRKGYSIQSRLGDCSISHKDLVVRVDGYDYTIIFDQNYTLWSDDQMLNVFTNVLGEVADVELYNKGADYFPEIEPSFKCKKNGMQEAILCGMGIKIEGDKMIKATCDDEVDAIVIDDVAPDCYGRVVSKALLSIYKEDRHHVCLEKYPVEEIQFYNYRSYFGIGDTPGVFVNKASVVSPLKGANVGGYNRYLLINK